MKKFFELNKPYQFDINDVIAVIYVICTIMGIYGMNATPLFFVGCLIGTIACIKCRRINLLVLNGALLVLNAVNLFKMIF